MLKPNAVLSRILSLLLLPPTAATALSSAQLVKGSVAPMAAFAAPAPFADNAEKEGHPGHSNGRDKNSNTLTIESPTHGQLITTTTAKVVLNVGRKLDRASLRVVLNGKDVTSRFSSGFHDEEGDGTVSATLTTSNGLRKGVNRLRAGIVGRDKHLEVRRVKFDYYYGLGAGQNLPNYLPSTVGFSLNSGGAQPWVSMTTGTPAGLQDNSDQTQFSLPYQDMTFPTANDTPCTTRYQVVVLNRQNPAVEDAYWCVNDAASSSPSLQR